MKESKSPKDSPSRRNTPPVKVYCLPPEKEVLNKKAIGCGLSLSSYLLKVGLGYAPESILDYARVEDLAKVNGDLGRLGGLLKLWLSNDEKIEDVNPSLITELLKRIEETRKELKEIMQFVLKRFP